MYLYLDHKNGQFTLQETMNTPGAGGFTEFRAVYFFKYERSDYTLKTLSCQICFSNRIAEK